LGERGLSELPPGVLVYEIAGPMFFGAVEHFERALLQTHSDPKTLIIRLSHVPFMDITGIQTLAQALGALQQRGVHVIVCEANARVLGKLRKTGVIAALGADGYCETLASALRQAGLAEPG
jgi:sulfate permease, SulP family